MFLFFTNEDNAEKKKENQEILDEMKKDGIETDGLEGGKPEEGKSDDDEGGAEEGGDGEEKGKKDEEDDLSKKKKDDEGDDGSNDDNDDEDDSDEVEPKRQKRQPKFMPVKKHLDIKKTLEGERDEALEKATKAEKDVSVLQEKMKNASPAESDTAIKEFVEKHDLDLSPDAVKDLTEIVAKSIEGKTALPKDTLEKISEVLASSEEKKQEENFGDEYKSLVEDDSLSEEDKKSIEDNKDELHKLAFTEKYANKSLFEIYFRTVKPTLVKKKKTAEESGGGSKDKVGKSAKDIDWDDPKQVAALSDEEFDKLAEEKAKEGSRFVRK